MRAMKRAPTRKMQQGTNRNGMAVTVMKYLETLCVQTVTGATLVVTGALLVVK